MLEQRAHLKAGTHKLHLRHRMDVLAEEAKEVRYSVPVSTSRFTLVLMCCCDCVAGCCCCLQKEKVIRAEINGHVEAVKSATTSGDATTAAIQVAVQSFLSALGTLRVRGVCDEREGLLL